MKTASYNGSRKTYFCPATNIYDIKIKERICQSSPSIPDGGEEENVTIETKRRRGLFNDDEGVVDTSKSIW